ncbi:MAG: PAS domain-containing protein, partial [Oscillospiraceae bacterium]
MLASIKKDSRSIWVLDKCSIKKASDENIYLYHVITDISNQKEKEQLLLQRISELEREKQNGTTMSSNHLLTYEANVTQNSIISVNPDWAREFGITSSTHFSDLVISIAENAVAPEHRVIFLQTLSRESIISAFEENRHILSIEYLKHINNNQFRWFRKNINIIQDNITKDISIRCYIADIDDKKSEEIKAFEEQRLYETMRSKADIIYEINVTKNRFITGHDAWVEIFGVCETSNYSQMMKEFSEKALHPDDREGFKQSFMRKHVLEAYENGTRDIVYEYRRPDKSGEYIWVCCTMHLFSDPDTQEIRGHSYVENINEKKEKQLELIYKAEHDLLTGFYNKAATEKYITDFLSVGDGKVGKHAFII